MASELTEVGICNLALTWLAESPLLSPNLEALQGITPAALCSTNYPHARDCTLEDGDWRFATVIRKLAIVADPDPALDPRPPLTGTLFLRPPDILRIIEADEGRNSWRLRYELVGEWLVANTETCWVRGVVRVTNTAKFSPMFADAVAARLAADIARGITESQSIHQTFLALYEDKLRKARARDGMQGTTQRVRSDRLRQARR